MIAKLTGILDRQETNSAIIDVNGVGYLVSCSGRTLTSLGTPGTAVSLVIETHLRDDGIYLYGFGSQEEKNWFRLLTSVQGVGARVALAILSVLSLEELTITLAAQDKESITRADGVGPKLANRILSELKDKVATFQNENMPAVAAQSSASVNDAVSALVNLGYRRSEAFTSVMRLSKEVTDVSELVRQSLKELGSA